MNRHWALVLVTGVIVCFGAPAGVLADYYDSFSDSDWWLDPNYSAGNPDDLAGFDPNYSWHIDDPQWWFYNLVDVTVSHDIVGDYRALRLYADAALFPFAVYFGAADDGVYDPNVSTTYWDDTTNHYVLARTYYRGNVYTGDPNDPNDDKGRASVLIHGDELHWTAFVIEVDFHNCAYVADPNDQWSYEGHEHFTQHASLQSGSGTVWKNFQRIWIDPNGCRDYDSLDPNTSDPNDTTWVEPPEGRRDPNYDDPSWLGVDLDARERNGFWLVIQFEQDPNYETGDPRGKFLRGAFWAGDKCDWDGKWILEGDLGQSEWADSVDPNEWYWAEGRTTFGAWTASPAMWGAGFPAECAYDDIEARMGIFTNVSRILNVIKVKSEDYGEVTFDPDLLADSSDDPNDPTAMREYTDGTEVVLVAYPNPDRGWKKWKIWEDPNQYPDPNYTISDTNTVLYLTMDKDYAVEAIFSCSASSSVLPPLAVVMMILALGAVVRRVLSRLAV
jgi:hypothetical protein